MIPMTKSQKALRIRFILALYWSICRQTGLSFLKTLPEFMSRAKFQQRCKVPWETKSWIVNGIIVWPSYISYVAKFSEFTIKEMTLISIDSMTMSFFLCSKFSRFYWIRHDLDNHGIRVIYNGWLSLLDPFVPHFIFTQSYIFYFGQESSIS